MFNFFSSSSSKGRYPNPNRGGSHYQKGGFFKNFGSFSGSGSGRRRYNHQNQQPYPGQDFGQGYRQPHPQQGYSQQTGAGGSSQVCPNCGTQVPAGSKFCLSCGAKMNTSAFCTNCGKPLPPGSKFCPECGSPVNP